MEEVPVHLLILQPPFEQGEDVALDVEDGCLQFMRQVADELPPELFAFLELTDLRSPFRSPGGNLCVDPPEHIALQFDAVIALPCTT